MVGTAVLDGMSVGVTEGEGVSVNASVEVAAAVSVEAGSVKVVVPTGKVFVGGCVPTGVSVDGELQANKVVINKLDRKSFGLIRSFWGTIPQLGGLANK